MSQVLLTANEQMILQGLASDDYQHGTRYPGEPVSIVCESSDDLFNIKFYFENTDLDIAEEWVSSYVKDNGFDVSRYEIFSQGDVDALVVTSFPLTEVGFSTDYEFSTDDLARLNLLNVHASKDTSANTSSTTVTTTSASTPPKRAYKRKTVTTVLPATPASKQLAAVFAGSGQSIKGASNRVSTLDANGNRVSAAKQIQTMLSHALPNITDTTLSILTDPQQCKQMASLGFPLLMQVNPALTYKQQATFNGKYRYSRTIVNVLGNDYYVTNHLFARNVAKVDTMFKTLGLYSSSAVSNTATSINTNSDNSSINSSDIALPGDSNSTNTSIDTYSTKDTDDAISSVDENQDSALLTEDDTTDNQESDSIDSDNTDSTSHTDDFINVTVPIDYSKSDAENMHVN